MKSMILIPLIVSALTICGCATPNPDADEHRMMEELGHSTENQPAQNLGSFSGSPSWYDLPIAVWTLAYTLGSVFEPGNYHWFGNDGGN